MYGVLPDSPVEVTLLDELLRKSGASCSRTLIFVLGWTRSFREKSRHNPGN
jgi:hypothetical protein